MPPARAVVRSRYMKIAWGSNHDEAGSTMFTVWLKAVTG